MNSHFMRVSVEMIPKNVAYFCNFYTKKGTVFSHNAHFFSLLIISNIFIFFKFLFSGCLSAVLLINIFTVK